MLNKFTCIIIDDEPKAIELLKESLGYLYDNIYVTGTYTSWTTALQALQTQNNDIVFSDISMPGKNGIELLKLLPDIESEIIFITAHSDFALNAFQLAATGYILKPIDDAELKVAVDKAIERVNYKKQARSNQDNITIFHSKIGIPNNRGIDYLDVNDIYYFETVNKCTKVVTKSSEILSSYNIGRFKNVLANPLFYQVHRSYIINLNCIRRYETAGLIIMLNGKEIPIAKNERDDFISLFKRINKTVE